MRPRAREFVNYQVGPKVVPRTCQYAKNLLIRAADVMAILIGTRIVKRDLGTIYASDCACVRRVNPSFAEIMKVRIKSLYVHARPGLEVIVHASCEPIASAIIRIGSEILAANKSDGTAVWTRATL